MRPIDFTKIFKKHPGKWVALADDEKTILAASKSAKKTLKDAQKAGVEKPILFKVPKTTLAYVGGASA